MAPIVIAHRGASGEAPENTIAAFDLALEQGAEVLEIDVRLTADGIPVALHDETLARTAGDPRAIGTVTADGLGALAGEARPPALRAIFDRYGEGARYLLDLKEPGPAAIEATLAAVGDMRLGHRVQAQAFDKRALRRVRAAAPALSLGQLYPELMPGQLVQRDLARVASVADTIAPHRDSVTPALLAAAHRRGLRVNAWTVNDPGDMDRLESLGVDGLITDVPALARVRRADVAVAA